jgi:hypothetical protein
VIGVERGACEAVFETTGAAPAGAGHDASSGYALALPTSCLHPQPAGDINLGEDDIDPWHGLHLAAGGLRGRQDPEGQQGQTIPTSFDLIVGGLSDRVRGAGTVPYLMTSLNPEDEPPRARRV